MIHFLFQPVCHEVGGVWHTVQILKISWLEEKDLGMFVVLIKIRA